MGVVARFVFGLVVQPPPRRVAGDQGPVRSERATKTTWIIVSRRLVFFHL